MRGDVRKLEAEAARKIDFKRDMFNRQLDLMDDPAKQKAVIAGRRGGKSNGLAYYLVKTCYETPNTPCLYAAKTLKTATNILWHYIEDINARYKIGAVPNVTDRTWTFSNGSLIRFGGADTAKEIEKYRGVHYSLAVVDECGTFGAHLERFIKEVLGPTMADTNGTMVLSGTPGLICGGFWYKVTTRLEQGWSVHDNWTFMDNPRLPYWDANPKWKDLREDYAKDLMTRYGLDEESPAWQREWLAQWVEGSSMMVYGQFNYDRNTYHTLPSDIEEWHYIMAVDYGIVDASAILVGAWSPKHPVLYVVDVFKQENMNPEQMAHIVNDYVAKYAAGAVAADSNGLGKAFVSQLQSMYQLPIHQAEKKDKIGFMELLNDEFRRGRIKIQVDMVDVMDEIAKYQWLDPEQRIVQPNADDHCLDALLYLFRLSSHFNGQPDKKRPERNTEEELEEYWRRESERLQHGETDWWQIDTGISIDF